jgi:hypothetical protein
MKTLKRLLKSLGVLALAVFLSLSLTIQAQAITYSGSLSGLGLVTTASWTNASTVFSWTVKDVGTSGGYVLWQYDYALTVPSKAVSHFIIEVSDNAVAVDFIGDGILATYSAGGSNPNMPGTMYGLKFNDSSAGDSLTVSFRTTRSPVWGDFYAKDGTDKVDDVKIDVTAWNEGFSRTDPVAGPANGSVDNHILRPDTKTTLVPEPTTMLLLGLGLVGLAGVRRKMK